MSNYKRTTMCVRKIAVRDFRRFKNVEIPFGEFVTLIAGQNGTSKSTLLGMLAQPFNFSARRGDGESIYTKNYHGLNLDEFHDIGGRPFEYNFDQVFRLSDRYDFVDEKTVNDKYDYSTYIDGLRTDDGEKPISDKNPLRTFARIRTDRRKKGHSLRLVTGPQTKSHDKGEGNYPHPVIYLGLSRLWPIAESKKVSLERGEFTIEEQKWFSETYGHVLCVEEENDVEIMSAKEKSRSLSPLAKFYDGNSCSAGQDNLSRILTAILSFKRLKRQLGERWRGGMLLVDEIDATFHPKAQAELLKLLCDFSCEDGVQVIATTHSLFLLRRAFKSEQRKFTQVCHLKLEDGCVIPDADASYENIVADLEVDPIVCKRARPTGKTIDVLMEDQVAIRFMRTLWARFAPKGKPKLNFVNVSKVTGKVDSVNGPYLEIISKVSKEIGSIRNLLILPDGDMNWANTSRNENVLALPTKNGMCFEAWAFYELWNLKDKDDFWHSLGGIGVTRQAVIVASRVHHKEGKPTTDDAKKWWEGGREKFKTRWDKSIMDLVCDRNPELCKAFIGKVVRRCEEMVK